MRASRVADDENFAGTFWQVAVRRWTGSAWEAIGAALNHDAAVSAWGPSVATDGEGRPWAAWQEGPPGAGPLHVHVKRLNRL